MGTRNRHNSAKKRGQGGTLHDKPGRAQGFEFDGWFTVVSATSPIFCAFPRNGAVGPRSQSSAEPSPTPRGNRATSWATSPDAGIRCPALKVSPWPGGRRRRTRRLASLSAHGLRGACREPASGVADSRPGRDDFLPVSEPSDAVPPVTDCGGVGSRETCVSQRRARPSANRGGLFPRVSAWASASGGGLVAPWPPSAAARAAAQRAALYGWGPGPFGQGGVRAGGLRRYRRAEAAWKWFVWYAHICAKPAAPRGQVSRSTS